MKPAKPAKSRIVVLAISLAVVGCHKSSERESDEAAKASAVAATQRTPAASERAAKEQADVATAIERERHRYHELLTKEIAWVDRRVTVMQADARRAENAASGERAVKDADVNVARQWRERLKQDLDAVDHLAPGADWSVVKMRIDRDLDEDRPVAIPRTYEKPYGI